MFRILCIACMSVALSSGLWGQTIYSLTPDTKGNQIQLTVGNTSPALTVEQVTVKLQNHRPWLTFPSASTLIPLIGANKQQDVSFTFDVDRTAPVSKRDTLDFLITDKRGFTWTKSIIVQYAGPTEFGLDQNFPNPFNPSTTIFYQLPKDSRVGLKVFDILGREVATLVNEDRPAGYHDARWDAGRVASGVYFYRMEAKPLDGGRGFQQVKKLMIVK